MINHFTSQAQTCQLLILFLNIERKLWKVVQPEVPLMSINFKFEVPILWLFQVQMITNIRVFYNGNVKHIFTVCHSRQINVATWFLVLPIDIENKSTIKSINVYIYCYISSFGLIFAIPPAENSGITKSTGWAIIELSIRQRVRTFLVSWGQTTSVKYCWFIVKLWVLVCNNIYRYEHDFGSFYCNPTILEMVSIETVSIASMCQHGLHWESFFTEIQQQGIILALENAYG